MRAPDTLTAGTRRRIPRSWWPWCSTAGRLVLAGVWAWAGVAKLGDPDASVRAVRAYDILPETFVKPFAWGLPFVELALAVLLLLGIATRPAAWASAALLLVFIGATVSVWARGLQIDCGCFGGGGQSSADATSYLRDIGRDGLLLCVALLVAAGAPSRLALDNVLSPEER
ncbi:MAG TPA: MauE/DoxX family redox-associated membrane protein [Acidimicrobiia bacterium]|nr:MauE/DoxX family redox-associated membrane protein [Acidimicrobiia bacterium]